MGYENRERTTMKPIKVAVEICTAGDLLGISDAFAEAFKQIEAKEMSLEDVVEQLKVDIAEIKNTAAKMKPWEWV